MVARPRRVWLIGSMGAGKTAVGAALAEVLGWPLLDNDSELLRRTGQSVSELAGAGWDALHGSESDQLRAAASTEPPFVAGVAGSVGDRPDDLALLRRAGAVVYLRARPATLAVRVGTGEGRPWLDGDALAWLTQMLSVREPAYLAASDVVVDVDGEEPVALAATIAAAIGPVLS